MKEAELREKFEKRLGKYFDLFPEQKSTTFGKLLRLDLVIRNKQNPEFVFGIEFKRPGRKRGNSIAQWINQANDYTLCEWDFHTNAQQWGTIPIIICPQVSGNYWEYVDKDGHKHNAFTDPQGHHNINSSLFGLASVGEVRVMWFRDGGPRSLNIIINNKTLWKEWFLDDATEEFFNPPAYEKTVKALHQRREEYRNAAYKFLQNA